MGKIHELAQLGQSIWYDNIRRALLDSGELQALVKAGVSGITSNPSIFEKAIAGSADYDQAIVVLAKEGKSVKEIFEALALEDIQRAADLLRAVYDHTKGLDGYVSLEVSPTLAHDTAGTISQARRLFAALDRPNAMIKVPATPAGVPAIETLIGEGININVTLVFSLVHYEAVAHAYLAGLEKLAAAGGDLSQTASVASFFISRVDSAVDSALEQKGNDSLQGKIGIANAKAAYARFHQLFSSERWQKLAKQGAQVQRPLWASTSTKNPLYPDTLYVDQLIGLDTVNTVPPATLYNFMDHGTAASTLETGLAEAQNQLAQLAKLGISLEAITQQLQDDGVASFASSFQTLMDSIAQKRDQLQAEWKFMTAELGDYQVQVDAALAKLRKEKLIGRVWKHDHTVWKPDPTEITNRLGWLHTAEAMLENIPRLQALVDDVQAAGYTEVLLLGMGGSSLAPEVFHKVFGAGSDDPAGGLPLAVLDSTDPGAVLAHAQRIDIAKTLFIVATKSGGTVETLSFFKFFYNRVLETMDRETAGQHFVAITDPGSKLEKLAQEYQFRDTFLNDPHIGGRYSVLSYFGMAPAALVGVDLEKLLNNALTVACNCDGCNCPVESDNVGGQLGAILGQLASIENDDGTSLGRRDKVTFIISPAVAPFGDWVEQLIAESIGKEGQGIVPVVGEPVGSPELYGDDRLFVYLRLKGDDTHDAAVEALRAAGHPVLRIQLRDRYDLGGQFFLWEMATAVAGHFLNINPFDQPNVEAAKILARQMVADYQEQGELPQPPAALQSEGITLYDDRDPCCSLADAMQLFLYEAHPDAYLALQAFIQPTNATDATLLALRSKLRDKTRLATTVGYGPRFLHSTGQLHKGDAGRGLFIQFTADDPYDAPIPDTAGEPGSTMTFGVLKMAQVLGDAQALRSSHRRVIRFHLGQDVAGNLSKLIEWLA